MTKPSVKLTVYTFFFAPEGRQVDQVAAATIKQAKAVFYKAHPQFKKAKGEIYWETK